MTDREKAIEQAKQYLSKHYVKTTPGSKFMADFAIEYSKEREREAFEAARLTNGVKGMEYQIYPTPEDYLNREIKEETNETQQENRQT